MSIYFGTSVKHLEEVARQSGLDVGEVEIKKFPNNETYVRFLDLEKNKGKTNVIVQSTKTDEDIVTLLLLIDAYQQNFGDKPIVLIPYAGYGKQDKKFLDGESISFRSVLKPIYEQSKKVYLVNPHPGNLRYGGEHEYYGMNLHSLSAIPLLGNHLKERNLENLILIGPDFTTNQMVDEVKEMVGGESRVFEKNRGNQLKEGGEVVEASIGEMEGELGDIEGKNIIIIDDWISAGGTVIKAIKKIKDSGNPKSIDVYVIHGELAKNAGPRILEAGANKIVTTDTLQNEYSEVSIINLIKNIMG